MGDARGGDLDRIAPIIPLFGGGSSPQAPTQLGSKAPVDDSADAGTPSDRHPARGGRAGGRSAAQPPVSSVPHLRALAGPEDGSDETETASLDEVRLAAEESLVRKLRARSLSVSESKQVLKGQGLSGEIVDDVIDDFTRRGYLNDLALAEVLVRSGVERKGQGRVALSRSLAQRGIPRDIIQGALDQLPDDDDDRALEFARSKARSLSRLDHDTALRRLVGQLSRRGYGGSVAMKAAKTALRETTFGETSGVRFVDSD